MKQITLIPATLPTLTEMWSNQLPGVDSFGKPVKSCVSYADINGPQDPGAQIHPMPLLRPPGCGHVALIMYMNMLGHPVWVR